MRPYVVGPCLRVVKSQYAEALPGLLPLGGVQNVGSTICVTPVLAVFAVESPGSARKYGQSVIDEAGYPEGHFATCTGATRGVDSSGPRRNGSVGFESKGLTRNAF